jgi:sugar phosphate isomerase/epimerase
MSFPRLQLSVIGDEIGPSLDEMISFAHEHGLKRLDMRTVGGRSLLGMKAEEVIQISRTLENAGITVPAFVSPAFKWRAPGRLMSAGKVDFAFDPEQCPVEDWVSHAMQIAVILGAPHMRIFSYLRYGGFRPPDLGKLTNDLGELLRLASHYDVALQLENEPVCNVGNVAELAAFFREQEEAKRKAKENNEQEEFEKPRNSELEESIYLRPLVDIANAWSTGERPSDADIAVLAPLTTAIHLKDRDLSANCTVPLGDGDVPWPKELKRLLGGVKAKEVLASIETHCPHDGRNATARSLAGLRRIADEIGVEIV